MYNNIDTYILDSLQKSTKIALIILIIAILVFLVLLFLIILSNSHETKKIKAARKGTSSPKKAKKIKEPKQRKAKRVTTTKISKKEAKRAAKASKKAKPQQNTDSDFVVGKNVNLNQQDAKAKQEAEKKAKLIPKAKELGIENPEQYSFQRLQQLILMKNIKGVKPSPKPFETKEEPKAKEEKPIREESPKEVTPSASSSQIEKSIGGAFEPKMNNLENENLKRDLINEVEKTKDEAKKEVESVKRELERSKIELEEKMRREEELRNLRSMQQQFHQQNMQQNGQQDISKIVSDAVSEASKKTMEAATVQINKLNEKILQQNFVQQDILNKINNSNNNNNDYLDYGNIKRERDNEYARLFIEETRQKMRDEQERIKREKDELERKLREREQSIFLEEQKRLAEQNKQLQGEIFEIKKTHYEDERKRLKEEIEEKRSQIEHEKRKIEIERSELERQRFANDIENKILNRVALQTAELNQISSLMNKNNNNNSNNNNSEDNLLKTIEIELDSLSRKVDENEERGGSSLKKGRFGKNKIQEEDLNDLTTHLKMMNQKKMNSKTFNYNNDSDDNIEDLSDKTEENSKLLETIEIELDLLNKIIKENEKKGKK